MASFRRQGKKVEIRECLRTKNGPRQFRLASFEGVLTPEILDQVEERARTPITRSELRAAAQKQGIPVSRVRRVREARLLLAALRKGYVLDPAIVGLLRAALEPLPAVSLPAHLVDAAEWLGRSAVDRGQALRGLVRTGDRIVQSRGPLKARPRDIFPRFSSVRE